MTFVYVKINADSCITAVNSSVFLTNTDGWIKIDEGEKRNFVYAQEKYLPKPVRDEHGRFNFKLINGKVAEISERDKPPVPDPEPPAPTNAELAAAIAELAEVMFNG